MKERTRTVGRDTVRGESRAIFFASASVAPARLLDHQLVAPVVVSYEANLGTLLRNCDARRAPAWRCYDKPIPTVPGHR